jgi:hypothetical protein
MKYQIGDDIIVLHSHEEGKVVDLINEKMVMIEIRGVKFPAYMDQIDFPYFYRFTKKKLVEEKKTAPKIYIDNIPKEKPKPNQYKTEDGVWICFIPKFSLDDFNDEVVESLKVYIINKTDKAYTFKYNQELLGTVAFEIQNEIAPFHDFYIHDFLFEQINDSPNFFIEFALKTPEKLKADYYEVNYKPKPKQFFKSIEAMKEKNEPSIQFKLFDIFPYKSNDIKENKFDISKLSNAGFKVYDIAKTKQNLPPARSVIDLHIEKLVDDFSRKTNFEILTIQINEFEKWYEAAVHHHLTSFIVIHGVGKGKLKEEVHSLLKSKKEVDYFINQYDPRFGYGATEIFFKQ